MIITEIRTTMAIGAMSAAAGVAAGRLAVLMGWRSV